MEKLIVAPDLDPSLKKICEEIKALSFGVEISFDEFIEIVNQIKPDDLNDNYTFSRYKAAIEAFGIVFEESLFNRIITKEDRNKLSKIASKLQEKIISLRVPEKSVTQGGGFPQNHSFEVSRSVEQQISL